MGIEGSSSNNEVQNQEINQSTNEQIEQNQAEHQRSGEELEGNSTIDNEGERKQIEGKDDATESSERESSQLDKNDSIEKDTSQEQPTERESVSSEQQRLDNQDTIDGVASSTDGMLENEQEITNSLDSEYSIEDESLSETNDSEDENLNQEDSIEDDDSNDVGNEEGVEKSDKSLDSDDVIDAEETDSEDAEYRDNLEETEESNPEDAESRDKPEGTEESNPEGTESRDNPEGTEESNPEDTENRDNPEDDTVDETEETDPESTDGKNSEADIEDTVDEIDEAETEDTADKTEETEAEPTTDETGESEPKSTIDETEATDSTADETGKADPETTEDEARETNPESVVDETGETDSDNTSNQTEVVNKSELSSDLKESLENFNQEKWEQMSPEEKKESITELRDSVANELGLQNKPDVIFYNVQDATDFGGYSAKENAIYINEYNMGDAHETADTIAHESRHCWQHERAENPQNEQDLAFRKNFENYVSPSDDYQEYKNQPVEIDARQYALEVCQNIGEYRESFANDNELNVSDGNAYAYSELSQEKGAVFDNRPVDLESKVEVLPISIKALEKCEVAGISPDKVQEIREIPNGEKPNPDEYLSKDYIDNHLSKFEESGCYKIISDKRGEPTGTIGAEGVFVLNGSDIEKMIQDADGDPRKLEQALAMKPGYLGNNPYIIRCDEPHNLRMATGNEPNAWQDEWCPCGVTRDGTDEAVIDPMEKDEYSYKHVFGGDEWRK